MKTKYIFLSLLCVGLLAAGSVASAATRPAPTAYANVGKFNADTYTFTAAKTGVITAYYADYGTTASYTNTLGLLINGKDTLISGLENKTSSYGKSISFGNVKAGDELVFKLNVITTKETFFSQQNLNTDKINHVYSSAYAGDSVIPQGTYLAFEDLKGGGDKNYHDENFVFTNVATNAPKIANTPIPGAAWLFGTGIAGLVSLGKKRAKTNSFVA